MLWLNYSGFLADNRLPCSFTRMPRNAILPVIAVSTIVASALLLTRRVSTGTAIPRAGQHLSSLGGVFRATRCLPLG